MQQSIMLSFFIVFSYSVLFMSFLIASANYRAGLFSRGDDDLSRRGRAAPRRAIFRPEASSVCLSLARRQT